MISGTGSIADAHMRSQGPNSITVNLPGAVNVSSILFSIHPDVSEMMTDRGQTNRWQEYGEDLVDNMLHSDWPFRMGSAPIIPKGTIFAVRNTALPFLGATSATTYGMGAAVYFIIMSKIDLTYTDATTLLVYLLPSASYVYLPCFNNNSDFWTGTNDIIPIPFKMIHDIRPDFVNISATLLYGWGSTFGTFFSFSINWTRAVTLFMYGLSRDKIIRIIDVMSEFENVMMTYRGTQTGKLISVPQDGTLTPYWIPNLNQSPSQATNTYYFVTLQARKEHTMSDGSTYRLKSALRVDAQYSAFTDLTQSTPVALSDPEFDVRRLEIYTVPTSLFYIPYMGIPFGFANISGLTYGTPQ